MLIRNDDALTIKFEHLINYYFEKNEYKNNKYNHECLNTMLIPFREQLENLHKQIQNHFYLEGRERFSLIKEINKLHKLNLEMTQETINLTNALKGNNKIQGNWGETILARILETSGLRLGYEFETQVLINHDGQKYQPDVIIHLPKGKNIIIDSKISLLSYEQYYNNQNKHDEKVALKEHINSIRKHIKNLSQKKYHSLITPNSLEYILMFIAIEPAYLLALREAPEIIDEGLRHNVLLVCPSTLLIAIKTIDNLWKYENQNQNIREISERATKLYDKIRLVIEDIQNLGQHLHQAHSSYQSTIKRLTSGKGNLISQVEHLKTLGIDIKHPINIDEFKKNINI
uniref:DNA recombination protein RmuC n=1 Tax=Candidatus Aschnera chinzeii TaxID=1485666 RepID=A0AAT9G518_9ENTR|nr:MAG: hypothetical protein ACHINZ_4830 [Candidatus Aschnera chinzeii]